MGRSVTGLRELAFSRGQVYDRRKRSSRGDKSLSNHSPMSNASVRKPFALANWKMAMTLSESLAFARRFRRAAERLAHSVDVVLCPPYTALYALSRALRGTPIEVGAQDLSAASGEAHTGQISAPLLADAGCKWVMLGHWEVRRRTGEREADLNKKMKAAL